MPGNGQARMIQMLGVLSEIQMKKRAQVLAENQFEEAKHQFAETMGMDRTSKQYKQFVDALHDYAAASTDARGPLNEVVKALHLPPEMEAAALYYGANAPESLAALQNRSARQGYAAAGQAGQGTMDREAASMATTGMNTGQTGVSALTNQLAGGGDPTAAYGAQMIGALAKGFAQRSATGQTSDQAATSAYLSQDPNLIKLMAQAQAGMATPYQQAQIGLGQQQADIGRGGVIAEFDRNRIQEISAANENTMRLLSAKAGGGITPDNLIQAHSQMRELLKQIEGSKVDAIRNHLLANYNSLADAFDPSLHIKSGDDKGIPDKASYLDRTTAPFRGFPGAAQPAGQPSTAPMPGVRPTVTLPQGLPPAFYQQTTPQFQNPLTPFVPRP